MLGTTAARLVVAINHQDKSATDSAMTIMGRVMAKVISEPKRSTLPNLTMGCQNVDGEGGNSAMGRGTAEVMITVAPWS